MEKEKDILKALEVLMSGFLYLLTKEKVETTDPAEKEEIQEQIDELIEILKTLKQRRNNE